MDFDIGREKIFLFFINTPHSHNLNWSAWNLYVYLKVLVQKTTENWGTSVHCVRPTAMELSVASGVWKFSLNYMLFLLLTILITCCRATSKSLFINILNIERAPVSWKRRSRAFRNENFWLQLIRDVRHYVFCHTFHHYDAQLINYSWREHS